MATKRTFDSEKFARQFHYDGQLGAFCQSGSTLFRLWAPTAERVSLSLYASGSDSGVLQYLPMERKEKGIWERVFSENLNGIYYTYDVTVEGVTRTTADPYAVACGVNGVRSMVADLTSTDPEGWQDDCAPEKQPENIIYEAHVGDFSADPASGIPEAYRGKYLGLAYTGSTLHGNGIHPTGLDYLKTLGITHIELMPVYDYGSVDESCDAEQFNWGYDPVNYNVPEGSYSTNPYDGAVRIRELKQMIAALHRAGFRVIMDVVYNHTYNLDSPLNCTVPGYYYRKDSHGHLSNGSGCGNDTAGERSMCGKYILDSVLYWAEEYHIDGFRFDLMGLLPVELMNRIRRALDEEYGPGEKLLFGEPWSAGDTAAKAGTELAHKGNLLRLAPDVGAFCDNTRDAVKGSLFSDDARGFANGGGCSPEFMENCLRGWAGNGYRSPRETICYLSCHDDWTLWDRLVNTVAANRDYAALDPIVLRSNRLAAAVLCGCQGNLFLLSGEEFGRTKCGIKNTYNASMTVNRLDWNRAVENSKLVNYYRGLFALRKQMNCLCDKSETAGEKIRSIKSVGTDCVLAELTEGYKTLILIYNTGNVPCRVPLREGKHRILADDTDSFLWKKEKYTMGWVDIPPMSAMYLER